MSKSLKAEGVKGEEEEKKKEETRAGTGLWPLATDDFPPLLYKQIAALSVRGL
ncbi:MAG: hypothetical protein WED15_07280 [Akkermansiaceae bacterium]